MPLQTLPVISLDSEPATLSRDLGESFQSFGFAMVRDHGIDAGLIARAWALTAEFFALPEDEKRSYYIDGLGGARGYTPFGTEIAKGAKRHDLKEFWHVGRDLPQGHPLAQYMSPNVWPTQVEGFRETMSALFRAFEVAGGRVLEAIALHLGRPRDFFAASVEDGNSVMRLLHYPPLAEGAPEGAIRAAGHEDINTITLLLGAEEAGLELLAKDGQWHAVDVPAGALVINVGDMLQRQTNGRLRSTTHRVVNPRGDAARRARYSMPFFLHFRPDFLIEPLPECIGESDANPPPPPITSHDYLMQRLREINLA
jgi:isopenicillin N synthase-like dioxygenase